MSVFAAVDIGASGGRVMSGHIDRDSISLESVHRFANPCTHVFGHLRWNIHSLFRQMQRGLSDIADATSIGIATWAVDYGLLDEEGRLLADPVAYRDPRTAAAIDRVHQSVAPEELFAVNGLQFLPFTTLYQLASDELIERAAHAVLLPDLLAFWLTGELGSEVTNASTTGLLDARSREWSGDLFDRMGLRHGLLPPIEPPGTIRGISAGGVPVVTVGSHDTASAVVAVPATTDAFAYISSGTWSLVGLELEAPLLDEEARLANFSNEVGVDDRTRFLRNVGGLWLLQECMREWGSSDLDLMLAAAGALPVGGPTIDVDDPAFIPAGNMTRRIVDRAERPLDPPATVRCILDSLAKTYAQTIRKACDLTGRSVAVVHIVGGGSQNGLLCQLTADACQLPVVAGPVEATALGNVAIQARRAGAIAGSLEAVRSAIAANTSLRGYNPS